jgi:hypothetical protein
VADAKRYVTLRIQSWRLRADGLKESVTDGAGSRRVAAVELEDSSTVRSRAETRHRQSSVTLGKAEYVERQSLDALDRMRH